MIICAAVNVDGRIYRGHRHGAAIRAAIDAGEKTPITQKMQGFLTGKGTFVSRVDARMLAVASRQMPFDCDKDGGPLLSEDLY